MVHGVHMLHATASVSFFQDLLFSQTISLRFPSGKDNRQRRVLQWRIVGLGSLSPGENNRKYLQSYTDLHFSVYVCVKQSAVMDRRGDSVERE